MNKKILITLITILAIAGIGSAYYFTTTKNSGNVLNDSLTAAQQQGQPVRSAELKGFVKSIEGNEIIIANQINTIELTDEEKAAKKAERQSMTQEERQALQAEESLQAETENETITIPVGVKIMKSTGDADGELVSADISDIKVGSYISIWVSNYQTENSDIEFVKLKPTVD